MRNQPTKPFPIDYGYALWSPMGGGGWVMWAEEIGKLQLSADTYLKTFLDGVVLVDCARQEEGPLLGHERGVWRRSGPEEKKERAP